MLAPLSKVRSLKVIHFWFLIDLHRRFKDVSLDSGVELAALGLSGFLLLAACKHVPNSSPEFVDGARIPNNDAVLMGNNGRRFVPGNSVFVPPYVKLLWEVTPIGTFQICTTIASAPESDVFRAFLNLNCTVEQPNLEDSRVDKWLRMGLDNADHNCLNI